MMCRQAECREAGLVILWGALETLSLLTHLFALCSMCYLPEWNIVNNINKYTAECRQAECRYAECRQGECRGSFPIFAFKGEKPSREVFTLWCFTCMNMKHKTWLKTIARHKRSSLFLPEHG